MVNGPVPMISAGSVSMSHVSMKVPSSTWGSRMCLGYMGVPIERRKGANCTGRVNSTVWSSITDTAIRLCCQSPLASKYRNSKAERPLAGMSSL